MTPSLPSLGRAGVGLVVAVLVAGCTGGGRGGPGVPEASGDGVVALEDRPAREIVAAAQADLASLTSLRVSGTVSSGGVRLGIDLRLDHRGRCSGSLETPSGAVELRAVDGRIWMRPDRAYWGSVPGADAARLPDLVGGGWVMVGGSDPTAADGAFRGFCDADALVRQLTDDGDPAPAYAVAGTGRVDGSDVVRVEERDADGASTVRSVLLDAPHHLVRIERTGGADPGAVTLSSFDVPVIVRPPAARRTVHRPFSH